MYPFSYLRARELFGRLVFTWEKFEFALHIGQGIGYGHRWFLRFTLLNIAYFYQILSGVEHLNSLGKCNSQYGF